MIANRRALAALAVFSIAALAPFAASAQQPAQNPRIALVIGNATYKDQALATTANDAGLVAQTLQAAGFNVVGARDLDQKSVQTAFRAFLDKAAAAGPEMQAFVYFAGRGVQYNGDNYFVPVDAQINRDADVPIDALRISDFAHALAQTPGRARIIVLDAARANPYASQGSPLAPGLALVDPEPRELMAFNAAPGTLAGDEQGPYGVYGKTLAGAMRQGGVNVEDLFNQVRVTVNQETQGALIPWSVSKLGEPYYIFERAANAPAPVSAPTDSANQPIASLPAAAAYAAALRQDTMQAYEDYLAAYPDSDQARRVRAILAARREAAFWRRSVNANTPHAYWTYLRRYPHGPHVADARRRLAMISAANEPPPDFAPEVYADLPPPPPDEGFYFAQPYYAFDDFGPPPPPPPPDYYYAEEDDWRDLPPPPPPEEVGVLPVLAVGIPLIIGAVAYHEHFHRHGIAPADTRPAPPLPHTPPPLPANIKPVAPPPPVATAAPKGNPAHVKPLPPIAGPQQPVSGKPVAPTQPAQGKPPATILAPAAPSTTPAGKAPAVGNAAPGVKPPAGALVAPAPGKALPSPPPPVVPSPTAPSLEQKKLPVAPGGAKGPTPAAPQILTPKPVVNPLVVTPAAPPNAHSPQLRARPPQAPAYRAPPPQAPQLHAPPPQAPAYHAPPPQAPQFHAAPSQAPAYHAPPPQAPQFHAAPSQAPAYHAPPPQAPQLHAPPPQAPVVRAPPPAAARGPACGSPGLPRCPK